MSEATDKVNIPPQDIDAEMSLIGAVLQDDEVMSDVADKITPDEFYEPKHQMIFSAMIKLYDSNRPIDLLTLTNQLKSAKQLTEVGGRAYLAELAESPPAAGHAVSYAEIVRTTAMRRRYIKIGVEMARLASDDQLEAKELSDQVESMVYRANSDQAAGDLVSIETLVAQTFDKIEEITSNPDRLRASKQVSLT
jgi:replicative DNA helicase